MDNNPPLLFQIFFTLIISVIGIVGIVSFLSPKFLIKNLKINNELQGVKTKITPRTILFGRIVSLLTFFVAILMLYIFYGVFF